MATLSSPLRVCRGILKELRAIQGPSYKESLAYSYVMDQFRKNKSTRNHLYLHKLYHGKGERSPDEAAGLVGLRMPTQPGGKGWEK